MTIQEYFARHWQMLIGRLEGPMNFRFVMQPVVAVTIAIRVAFRDTRAGRPPYLFWPSFADPVRRKELIRLAWKDIGKVFVVAFVLDLIYELIVHRWIYPGQALIVALCLAVIPYFLIRGSVTRILRRVRPTRNDKPHFNESDRTAKRIG